jgi:hypothetical protein
VFPAQVTGNSAAAPDRRRLHLNYESRLEVSASDATLSAVSALAGWGFFLSAINRALTAPG